jgi:3-deoxy-D-manno-octulosonic acid kinase
MKPVTLQSPAQRIVYDADVLPTADAALFDPQTWRAQGRVSGSAPGRGTTVFIDAPFGEAVLRRYLRGGLIARLSHDRYLSTGFERSRPWREFHLLRQMHSAGLNVPAPLAALVDRQGLFYRGALLTRRIAPARPLVDHLADAVFDWQRLGGELAAFHRAGVAHADLNARNILVHDDTGAAWLLDFDRSHFTPGAAVDGRRNLARLRRSLEKLWPQQGPQLDDCWQSLRGGYRAGS